MSEPAIEKSVTLAEPPSKWIRRQGKARVYIVDDQVLVRRGLASLIRAHADLDVCGESGDYATAAVDVCAKRPDVLIAELCLGGENGIEFISRIKAIYPAICVIVLTQASESVYTFPVLKAGASSLVTKQEPPARILDVIRRALEGQIVVSSSVAASMLGRMINRQESRSFSPNSSLSSRELEIFSMIGAGTSTRRIADRLRISIKTVEAHRAHIKEKAGIESSFELVHTAMRWSGGGVSAGA